MRQIPPTPQQRFPSLGSITTPYGGKTAFEGTHPGVDIANRAGTPIKSPVDGVVTGNVSGQPQGEGFGNFVTIKDGNGQDHYFSHLRNEYVKKGDRVQKSQPIGEMGNSGGAYSKSGRGDGTHLDYRIVNAYGKFVNPKNYLKKL